MISFRKSRIKINNDIDLENYPDKIYSIIETNEFHPYLLRFIATNNIQKQYVNNSSINENNICSNCHILILKNKFNKLQNKHYLEKCCSNINNLNNNCLICKK